MSLSGQRGIGKREGARRTSGWDELKLIKLGHWFQWE